MMYNCGQFQLRGLSVDHISYSTVCVQYAIYPPVLKESNINLNISIYLKGGKKRKKNRSSAPGNKSLYDV